MARDTLKAVGARTGAWFAGRLSALRGRWPAASRSRVADVLLALGVWAVYVTLAVLQDRFSPQGMSVLAFAFFTVSSAALVWWRRRPITVVAVTVVCDCVIVVSTGWQGYGLQAMLALYAAGSHGAARRAWVAAVAVGLFYPAVSTAVQLATGTERQDSGSLGVFVPLLLVGLGRLVRLRRETARRRQAELAEEIVRAERRHISRELHDVVAHNISTMQVLMGAARTTMARDPGGAEAALLSAERAGREAMAEMRQLLHVLRADRVDDPAGPGAAPVDGGSPTGAGIGLPGKAGPPGGPGSPDGTGSPGGTGSPDGPGSPGGTGSPARRAAALPSLVGRAREADQPASLEVTGTSGRLPAAVDHAIYRIVQEALTNARKHAGNVPVRVRVGYEPAAVEVEVIDDGPGTAAAGKRYEGHSGGGFGLGGMAERVALCGGRLETGPLPGGGFRVHARLPLPVLGTDGRRDAGEGPAGREAAGRPPAASRPIEREAAEREATVQEEPGREPAEREGET
ncbi:sensor histidine kinase [Streptosporangium sp. OZ121]|uniref:sensor histidine kinase n=1 Tax=Streptosporangium sp. OZ121 TaxID=3444183 RepID=UPI003F79F25E